uniref:Uncharacterized protein n=1 Tax=Megaselia scalaris TaxID=36166 RepID=T1GBB1_MEGSC
MFEKHDKQLGISNPNKSMYCNDLGCQEEIGQLGEALAIEAEKALGTLLCFSTDKTLRSVFIQGCLQNLATNKSVIVSLRLLPKLFASFQQFRTGGTYEITLWAERQHKMMFHFFNNIKYYASIYKNSEKLVLNANGQPMYSHMTQVSVRLQFLSSVYSSLGSPKPFRLSLDQVDALWEWLAHDPECADCLFAWLQCQAKGIDQHALDINAEMADVLWGDSHSDGEAINDSDDQVHNSVMKHLPVEGPYVRLLTNSAITDFLNDQDNDNGSYSSPMSNKSEKNMADFDDDDSPCEEEIAQLVESSGIIPKYNAFTALREKQQQERKEKELEECIGKIDPNGLPVFRVSEVCQPGKTLLWDLLQDNKIVSTLNIIECN